MGNLFLQAFIKYVESHPQILEQVIEQIVNAILAHIKANTPQAQA